MSIPRLCPRVQVKDFGRGLGIRTKTDGIDSFILARYGAMIKPRIWIPPSLEARILQDLLSRREAIAQDLQRECNRLENTEVADITPLIRQSIDKSITFLKQQLVNIQQDIDKHINKYPKLKTDCDLLRSIPAVGPFMPLRVQVSHHFLSVVHNHTFKSAEQLAALVPIGYI